MLVLSRKPGEQLQIGRDIRITVSRIQGNRVKLGIEAPEGIRILRSELASFLADELADELSGDPHQPAGDDALSRPVHPGAATAVGRVPPLRVPA